MESNREITPYQQFFIIVCLFENWSTLPEKHSSRWSAGYVNIQSFVEIMSKWNPSTLVPDTQGCNNLFVPTSSFNRTSNEKQNFLTLRSYPFIPLCTLLIGCIQTVKRPEGSGRGQRKVARQLINLPQSNCWELTRSGTVPVPAFFWGGGERREGERKGKRWLQNTHRRPASPADHGDGHQQPLKIAMFLPVFGDLLWLHQTRAS